MTLQTCKILLIEDDDQDVLYFHETAKDVESFDVTVTRVKNLENGLDEIKDSSFDMIFLDLGLPLNPPEETMLQMFGASGELPVVVYTHSDAPELVDAAKNLRFFDYVLKNELTPERFSEIVDRALNKSAAQEQATDTSSAG